MKNEQSERTIESEGEKRRQVKRYSRVIFQCAPLLMETCQRKVEFLHLEIQTEWSSMSCTFVYRQRRREEIQQKRGKKFIPLSLSLSHALIGGR